MRKIFVVGVAVFASLSLLGASCSDEKNKPSITSAPTTTPTTLIQSKTNDLVKEYRYYAGTIGDKKARLVYWPNETENQGTARNRWFFDGMYVYEGESLEPLRLTISFTSGGHFSASGYQIIDEKTVSNSVQFESTGECEGANEKGILCGEWSDKRVQKKASFNFVAADKFILEDYLKK